MYKFQGEGQDLSVQESLWWLAQSNSDVIAGTRSFPMDLDIIFALLALSWTVDQVVAIAYMNLSYIWCPTFFPHHPHEARRQHFLELVAYPLSSIIFLPQSILLECLFFGSRYSTCLVYCRFPSSQKSAGHKNKINILNDLFGAIFYNFWVLQGPSCQFTSETCRQVNEHMTSN